MSWRALSITHHPLPQIMFTHVPNVVKQSAVSIILKITFILKAMCHQSCSISQHVQEYFKQQEILHATSLGPRDPCSGN